jgi:hypothetical protein
MAVLGTPTNKCAHGMYTAGETRDDKPWARFCGLCNTEAIQKCVPSGRRALVAREEVDEEKVIDCFQFIHQEPERRLGR